MTRKVKLRHPRVQLQVGVLIRGRGRVVVVGVVVGSRGIQGGGGVARGRGRSALVRKHGQGVVVGNHDWFTHNIYARPLGDFILSRKFVCLLL